MYMTETTDGPSPSRCATRRRTSRSAGEHDAATSTPQRSIVAEKGQVSFHHSRLNHASDVNRGTRPRTAIALHMQDERNRYRVYLNEEGEPWRLPNDDFCRLDADGLPDYTDPTVFPVLYGPGARSWPIAEPG